MKDDVSSVKTKYCTNQKCKADNPQPLRNFGFKKGSKDGLNKWCSACCRIATRTRRLNGGYTSHTNGAIKIIPTKNINRRRAYDAVNYAIRTGRLPHISTQLCGCGNPADHYDHYKGYDPRNWLTVRPICKDCHGERHSRQNLYGIAIEPDVEYCIADAVIFSSGYLIMMIESIECEEEADLFRDTIKDAVIVGPHDKPTCYVVDGCKVKEVSQYRRTYFDNSPGCPDNTLQQESESPVQILKRRNPDLLQAIRHRLQCGTTAEQIQAAFRGQFRSRSKDITLAVSAAYQLERESSR